MLRFQFGHHRNDISRKSLADLNTESRVFDPIWNEITRRSGAGGNFLLLSTPLQNRPASFWQNTWEKHLKGFLIVTTQAKTKGNRMNVGVKYAEKQQRKFLPEKLKEGRNIIGLQVCGFSHSNCFPKIQIFYIIVCSKQFSISCYTFKISFFVQMCTVAKYIITMALPHESFHPSAQTSWNNLRLICNVSHHSQPWSTKN